MPRRVTRAVPIRAYLASVQSDPARRFADYVLAQTAGPLTVLRYSQRLELLAAARRFGVGRFEANLLIAAIVERHRAQDEARAVEPAKGRSMLKTITAVMVVEAAVLIGAWWTLFH